MVVSALAPIAAAAASVAAGLVVFALWDHQTGADVLRETRRDVVVWEPETDFVGRARIRLRTWVDEGEVHVKVRVAFVEHLTRMQVHRLQRGRT